MIFIIIIALLWLIIATTLVYGLIFLLIALKNISSDKKHTGDFRQPKHHHLKILLISTGIAISLSCYHLLSNPAHNYKTAYIEKQAGKYIITLQGKKNLMVHDLISLLKKGTYTDSCKFEIPRASGIIDGLEIPNRPGSYKFIKGNAIEINNNSMTVHLFYYNYDDKKADPSSWNGSYELEWRTGK